jgi:hypothetical protein
MAIEGINTGMTPTQFTRARSLTRTVETAEQSASQRGGAALGTHRNVSTGVGNGRREAGLPLLPPTRLHFTYRPIPGKSAAKRTPQVADTNYWSLSLNRVG